MNPTIAELIAAAGRLGLRHAFPADVESDEFLVLTDGERRVLINKTKTPFLSAVHAKLVTDKFLSGRLMRRAGLPVAPKRLSVVCGEEDARFMEEQGEIVVKPNRADRGIGVTACVSTPEALVEAYAKARPHGPVLLERQIHAKEYRILVIDGAAVAVLERQPVAVVGDGRSSVRSLIGVLNADPRRGPSAENKPMRPIRVDAALVAALARDGHRLEDVPPPGREVRLSCANHLDSGGLACDRTDEAHPTNLRLAVEAASLFSVDVAGVDFLCPDISAPLGPSDEAAILEVNPCPDLRWHIYPAAGRSRPVADRFVEYVWTRARG